MDKLWKIIKHNQAFAIAIAVTLILVLWVYGCSSTVVSIVNPPERLSRPELEAEIAAFHAKAKLCYASLDQQDNLKSTVFNAALDFAQGGTVNPVSLAVTLFSILGIGSAIDNRRKDVLIKTLKNNVTTSKIPPTNSN